MQLHISSEPGVTVPLAKPDSTVQQQPVQEAEPQPLDAGRVEASVNNLNKHLALMKESNYQVEFDKDIDRVVVKYKNSIGEVVRQVPTEQFVEFQKEFVRTIGLLFNTKI